MIETTETVKNEETPKINEARKVNFYSIKLELTFDEFPTMILSERRLLHKDIEAAKQNFLGLKEEEQEPIRREYRARTLSTQLDDYPINLPAFPINTEETNLGEVKERLYEYFMIEENEELLDYFWAIYQRKLYPKELWSNRSA